MRIAFLVDRNIYLRIFGPIIDKALEMGHQVFCLHNYAHHKSGSKAYQFPKISQTPKFANGEVISLEFQTEGELIEKVLASGIQAIVSLDFPESCLLVRNKLKEKKVFWVALQSGFDTVSNSTKFLQYPDKFFLYSWEWLLCVFNYLKKTNQIENQNFQQFQEELKDKIEPVGFWLKEQKQIISQLEVKNKWGIPPGKKVVLFLPFPFGSSLKRFWTKYIYSWHNRALQLPLALLSFNKRWLAQVWEKQNDYQVCLAIKRFCEQNDGFLLVKCRKKDPAKRYLAKMADKVIYDESFYPSTIMECFSIADICFNFYSTAALESAAMGVSNICIAPDVLDWEDIQGTLWQTILEKEKDFFDFPGVSYKITIPQALERLPKAGFPDFVLDETKREKYHQKFIGDLNNGYSSRIIAGIENLGRIP